MAAHKRTVLSVFTGAGGLDLGLEAANFCVIGCIESDENARCTIATNRGALWPLLGRDIASSIERITPRRLGIARKALSILAGGPPCQPFSKAAQWSRTATGMRDRRSRCLNSFFRLAELFLPQVILLENVPEFIAGNRTARRVVTDALRRINKRNGTHYKLQWQIVNAADYGVPQRRRRAILIAPRDGKKFEWPKPTHRDNPTTAWDAIGSLSDSKRPVAMGKWARLLPSIPEGKNYQWHTAKGKGRNLFGYRTRYWSFLLKLAKHEPSWTLSAQPGPGTGPFHWENRPLTVKELLKLQTFASSWKVSGNHRAQVRQIGNATPPLLGEIIGRALGRQVFSARYPAALKFQIRRRRNLPTADGHKKVPVLFLVQEGMYAPHPGPGRGPKPLIPHTEYAKRKAA